MISPNKAPKETRVYVIVKEDRFLVWNDLCQREEFTPQLHCADFFVDLDEAHDVCSVDLEGDAVIRKVKITLGEEV